mmetsp:Transcript_41241/g.36577  ORF Transcript_41241/g.36577 Transcript_41241/m.36577 type:complete len:101 (-) Transcript_41241:83-385(-)|eukprot:CAMPEP_0114587296 /NCGR_PEP_ID=MMETSP0125-20121206/10291_1 /TAXON_ID=485358 ORGANISM="Aristerostoma sp., Strain ATCC 50986" /NCGR_SAMPLE_ID=MMETSP0125 /ASSEMBLY_ACC=CAM_ASM_000245 /LENGTH=100 /DNA_ID=CAMNT_0001783135 /DNA_START=313 /DNA_END=615 /DNA_ORIENTATION=+
MKKIQKIRARREADFIKTRIARNKQNNKGILEREIEKNIDLVEPSLKDVVKNKIQQQKQDIYEETKENDFAIEQPQKNLIMERRNKKSNKKSGGMGLDIE